jgi:8-oxo-dGTP pyrophosphatase MutT (NUDIX family)
MTNPKNGTSAERVQYAALPYRRNRASRTEVLLVTSRETGRWIIPNGWPIKRKAPHVTAASEAREEAGVVGRISRRSIGWFSYEKQLKGGAIVVCKVHVFKATERKLARERSALVQWMSRTKAAKSVDVPKLGDIIRTLTKRP